MKRARALKCAATKEVDGSVTGLPAGGPCALCRRPVSQHGGAHLPEVGGHILMTCPECCMVCGESKVSTQQASVLTLAQRLPSPPAKLLESVRAIYEQVSSRS